MKTSRTYVFLCLLGIVLVAAITIFVTQRYDPAGRTNLGAYVGGVCAVVYLGVIIAYWFAKILFQGTGTPDQERIGSAPAEGDFRHLKNWRTLFLSMTDPNDAEARRIARGLRWHLVLSFGITSVMMLTLTGGALLFDWASTGRLETMLWILLPSWFVSQILIFRKARGNWDRMMKGLGLAPEGGPVGWTSLLEAQVVYTGTRKGLAVGVGVGGTGSVAWAEIPAPAFMASYGDSGFMFEGAAPLEVKRWCAKLPRLEAWKGLGITGNAQGIAVLRPAIGTYLWLYDLWLAESMARTFSREEAMR